MQHASQPLATLRRGYKGLVARISFGSISHRLREMGFYEGQELEVLCEGNPMICRVGRCRLGLCRALASEVHVDTSPATSPQTLI